MGIRVEHQNPSLRHRPRCCNSPFSRHHPHRFRLRRCAESMAAKPRDSGENWARAALTRGESPCGCPQSPAATKGKIAAADKLSFQSERARIRSTPHGRRRLRASSRNRRTLTPFATDPIPHVVWRRARRRRRRRHRHLVAIASWRYALQKTMSVRLRGECLLVLREPPNRVVVTTNKRIATAPSRASAATYAPGLARIWPSSSLLSLPSHVPRTGLH